MNNEPLGLPKGSIRALLAMGFTASMIYFLFENGLIPESMMALFGAIIGYYFAKRDTEV